MKNDFDQLLGKATALHQKGDIKSAQIIYLQYIKEKNSDSDAIHFCGLTFAQEGNFSEAIHYFNQAIGINPNVTSYHCNLGEAYARIGNLQQALVAYENAFRLDTKSLQALFGKANTVKKLGNLIQAKQLFQQVLNLNPAHSSAYYNLGNTEKALGNYRSAMDCYQKCLAIQPDNPLAENNLGIIYQYWKNNAKAIEHYKKALLIQPNYKEAHSNLAKIYESQGDVNRSKKYYSNLLQFSPDDALLNFMVDTINPIIFQSKAAIDDYYSKIQNKIDSVTVLPFTPDQLTDASYNIFSDLIYNGKSLREIKEKYASRFIPNMPNIPVRKVNSIPHIAFVVTNGHEGVFIKCMVGILNQLDKKRFNVSVVCSQPNGKKIIAPTLEKGVSVNFIELPERFDLAVQTISNARIDVLNYWEIGTDTMNYFLPFLRLAPVQCTSWGWPITSGIPTVDYFISTTKIELSEADNHYSERLIRMDRIPVYYYAPPVPKQLSPLELFDLYPENNLYFCAQNLKKVHPDFDEIVLKILEQDKKGVVLFIEDKESTITNLLKQRLLASCEAVYGRIKFLPRMEEADYLSLLKQVDVALDTLHYGGGANTCYDAFVCGTPVITLPGEYHRSRYAYAAYQQMGVLDCISIDINDYVNKAVELANNPHDRALLSKKISESSVNVLEDKNAVEELSNVFEQLLKNVN